MFPSSNFLSVRSHPTRRSPVDGFGQLAPIGLAENVVGCDVGDDEDDENIESVNQIVSQRTWQTTTPDLAEMACRRLFDQEVAPIDRLSALRSNNAQIKGALFSLRSYRTHVKGREATRRECDDLLKVGSSLKKRRGGPCHLTNSRDGIVVGDRLSSRWMKNLPLSKPDLFRFDYSLYDEDYVGGGALGIATHSSRPDGVVASYPSPTRRNCLRVVSLSSDDRAVRRFRSRDIDTPNCDATQIVASSEHGRFLALGQDWLHVIDFGRFDRDDGKSCVKMTQSTTSNDHNFQSRFHSTDFNPWIESEVVVSAKDGDSRLWDLETGNVLKLFVGEVRFHDRATRLGSLVLFGSHPRQVVHANDTGVALWDVRRRNNGVSVDLFALPHSSLGTHERVCRVSRSTLDSHLYYAATSRSVVVVDGRMPNVPVSNFKHCLRHRPQFMASSRVKTRREEVLFVGCQIPWEVNALSLMKEEPSTPVRLADAAWRCPAPQDPRSFFALLDKPIKNLIGLATLDGETSDSSRVWQLSSSGELFETNLSRSEEANHSSSRNIEDRRRSSATLLDPLTDARESWRVLIANDHADKERDDSGDCILCLRRSKRKPIDRYLSDEDDEAETETRCRSCGLDKSYALAVKGAQLSGGVIKHHAESAVDVEELFGRMTLKERFAPEAKIFTLNKENLDAFMGAKNYERRSNQAESLDDEGASSDDFSSLWESDLMCHLSQDSFSTFEGNCSDVEGATRVDKRRRKRTMTISPGFNQTPEKLKKRIARCLWNPYFMQHIRCATPETSEGIASGDGGDESMASAPEFEAENDAGD